MLYKSNINEELLKIKKKISPELFSRVQRVVATTLLASNLRRIHNEGLNISDQSIGSYSIKPIYVNPSRSPRKFSTQGKTGTKFKNGKPHKTRFFKDGYRDFRRYIRSEARFVNVQLTGRLRRSYIMEQDSKDWIIGFDSYGSKISRGLEKKYGTIWGISPNEEKLILKVAQQEVKNATN